MFAVLTMQSEVGLDQWLLISPTAGVGGSQLSRESAAGVTIMGTAWGYYTFFAHLKKWTWTIAPSIWIHFLVNAQSGYTKFQGRHPLDERPFLLPTLNGESRAIFYT